MEVEVHNQQCMEKEFETETVYSYNNKLTFEKRTFQRLGKNIKK